MADFYPKEISVEWKKDEKALRGSPVVKITEGVDKMFSQTSQLDINIEDWLSGSEYTCTVTKNGIPKVLSTSLCSTYPISAPSVHLESVEDQNGFTATCEVFTAYKSKVFWISDNGEPSDSTTYKEMKDSDNRIQRLTDSKTFNKGVWKSMKSITCGVKHKCFTSVLTTMNIIAQKTTFPNMTLYHQLRSEPTKAKRVPLICFLTGFYPKEISVEWKEDKKPFGGSPVVSNMEGEDKKFSQTSQVDVDVEKWLSGSEYTCKVTQNTDSKELSISVCSTHPISSPSVHLESFESQDAFTATCEVFTAYKSKVFWILDGRDKKESKNYTDSTNTIQRLVHSRTFTKDEWKSMKSIACEVEHKCFTPVKKTMDLKAISQKHALLYIMAPSQHQLKHNDTVTLACLATEFYPKEHTFTWRNKGKEISEGITTLPAVEMKGDEADMYSVTSFLRIPESQWKEMDTNISCEFKHEAGNLEKTAGKTADCTKSIVATVIPPSNEELFLKNRVVLKCNVTGNLDNIDKVEWQDIDGTPRVSTKETEGTSQMHTLLVNFDEWANGTQFTCIVWHFESGDTIRMNYKRENGNEPQPPSVFILTPSEQTSSKKVTLICYAKGFFPKEVLFSWLADDKPVDRTQFQTTQVVKTGSGYSVYSQLSISAAAWERGVMYTCMVHHDAAFNTQMRTIVRTIDSLSKKATTVSLNLGLPRNCTA
ncbi:hypothetical protein SKAU_G00118590 [Synaphobranchus kaupii]|uniref:Ig-like domain-containing protein n=1 Tax=Synaphobranchus kaupii TaxID=118154 RepID=A0A9Q1FN98_SYNKA|nr:hypothetical protein SKAU_G00118590 [Synaphobranchus kaupii]